MKCEFCGKEEALPFVCNYCGGAFCADHRLPEAHQCKGNLNQRRTIVAPPQTSFSWQTGGSTAPFQPVQRQVFSGIELRDIAIAWLAIGFAFFLSSIGGVTGLSGGAYSSVCFTSRDCLTGSQMLAIALATVGPGFVLHELSHKFTAQRYGYWAEFRMWPTGLFLALVTSLIGFIIAAPGATYISGASITDEQNGRISLAGPLTNVLVALLFLPVFLLSSTFFWSYLGLEGVLINLILAAFNLIPVFPLDGSKVFRWNRALWAAFFFPLLAVAFLLIRGF